MSLKIKPALLMHCFVSARVIFTWFPHTGLLEVYVTCQSRIHQRMQNVHATICKAPFLCSMHTVINSMCFLNQNVHKQVNLTWLPTSKKTHWRVLIPFSKNIFWTKLNTVYKWLVKSSTTHNARVNMVIVDTGTQFWQCQNTIPCHGTRFHRMK